MISINKKKFLDSFKKNNPNEDIEIIKKALNKAIKNKKVGIKCIYCNNDIWAIGSALCKCNMCFNCITGSSDSSEDYEIDEVN